MKQNLLQILFLLSSFYSCNETNQKTVDSNIIDTEASIITRINDCNFLTKTIDENSSDSSQVKLIGFFENLKNNGESTYGYSLSIWKLDNEISGFCSFIKAIQNLLETVQ